MEDSLTDQHSQFRAAFYSETEPFQPARAAALASSRRNGRRYLGRALRPSLCDSECRAPYEFSLAVLIEASRYRCTAGNLFSPLLFHQSRRRLEDHNVAAWKDQLVPRLKCSTIQNAYHSLHRRGISNLELDRKDPALRSR